MGWTSTYPPAPTSFDPTKVGVVDDNFLTKWAPDPTKKGAGLGLTIGTMVDTGFSWHARSTFIILVPGPDLILTGECDFVSLQPGMGDATSGAFQLMIAYDGDAETLTAAITATVGKDPILYASGSACAFFDFNDPSAWYLDIGTKQLPIQATVAKILTGSAYLDLSSNELDAGAQAGFSGNFSAGPLKASVEAHVGFDASLTRHPLRLSGDAYLEGSVKVSAWKISVMVGLNASISMDAVVIASQPQSVAYKFHFEIDAQLHAHIAFINLSASAKFQVTVAGSTSPDNPDPPVYPIKAISIELPAHTAETWPLPITQSATGAALAEAAATPPAEPAQNVPPDSLPTIVFSVPVYDQNSIGTNPPLDGSCQVGNASYNYSLVSIVVTEADGTIAYSSNPADQAAPTNAAPIWGQWCEELGNRGKTRLQLFADNPYFLSLRTTGQNSLADSSAVTNPPPCTGVSTDVAGTCVSICQFPWVYVDHGRESFLLDGAVNDGFVLNVRGSRPCGHLPSRGSDASANSTPCWVALEPGDSLTLPSPAALVWIGAVKVTPPETPGRPIDPSTVNPAAAFRVFDAAGNRLRDTVTRTTTPNGDRFEILAPNATKIVFEKTLAVSTICSFTQQEATQVIQGQSLTTQLISALITGASGKLVPAQFAPFTTYTIAVTVSTTGGAGPVTFTTSATFTTGGPPGVLGANPPQETNPKGYPFGGSLADLTRYTAASMPQGDADRAFPWDNPYRGYNPSVVFNEGYVASLYELTPIAGNQDSQLTLNVVDANGNQLAYTGGGMIVTTVIQTPSPVTSYNSLWATRLSNQCGITQNYPPNESLSLLLTPRIAMTPRTAYSIQVTAPDSNNATRILFNQNFSSSRFLTATHHIQSHPDAVFPVALTSGAVFTNLAQASSLPAYQPSTVPDSEAALFTQILSDLGLPPAAPRETLDGSALYDTNGACRALYFTTPEPLPWDRIAINGIQATGSSSLIVRPTQIAITDFSIDAFRRGYVELVLLSDSDPSGISVTASFTLQLLHGAPHRITETLYTFSGEGVWPSGTVFRLVNGAAPQSTADVQERALAVSQFPFVVETFEAVAGFGGALLHARPVLSGYAAWNCRIVRKADGAGFFVAALDGNGNVTTISSGEIDFSLTVNRSLGAADPGNFRLWVRCDSAATIESLTWRVRVPAAGS
jgi:hypothetical protein